MRKIIYNTIIGGIFFLIPIFVIITIGAKLLAFFKNLGPNIIKFIGLEQYVGLSGSSLFATLLILMVCFLFGMLAKWSTASIFRNWFESKLIKLIPNYDYYRSRFEQSLEVKKQVPRPVVLVKNNSGWRLGIITSNISDDTVCVFIPFAPKTSDGEVLITHIKNIKPSGIDEKKLNEVLLKIGNNFSANYIPKDLWE